MYAEDWYEKGQHFWYSQEEMLKSQNGYLDVATQRMENDVGTEVTVAADDEKTHFTTQLMTDS